MANSDKQNEKVWKFVKFEEIKICKFLEGNWKSVKVRNGDWKSMNFWKILTTRLKKYENLANFEIKIEKVWISEKFWQVNS